MSASSASGRTAPSWCGRIPSSCSRRRTSLRQGTPETFVVWDGRSGGPVGYRADRGYGQDGVEPALSGTFPVTLASGKVVDCRPAFELLKELAAQYAPERSEAMTWVPAGEVRRAVRMFATEQPSCYYTWAGLEQHIDATQTNRAVDLLLRPHRAVRSARQQRALRQHPHQSRHGARAAAHGAGRPSARLCRASAGPVERFPATCQHTRCIAPS